MDEFALNECLENIPKNENERVFDFEIDEEMEMRKKRQANQRKRGKIANKLRAKYKENPSLFKEPIDWKSDQNEKRRKDKRVKEEKSHQNETIDQKKRKTTSKKKTRAFHGAQGGSGDSKAYDIEDPKNNKPKVRKAIPQHIK